jgi:hypothetical protein
MLSAPFQNPAQLNKTTHETEDQMDSDGIFHAET